MSSWQLVKTKVNSRPDEFPANLSRTQRKVAEATTEYGNQKAIARALGMTEHAVRDNLKYCYIKAGVRCAPLLVARYLKATMSRSHA